MERRCGEGGAGGVDRGERWREKKKNGEKENMTKRIKSKMNRAQVSGRQHNSSPRCTIHSELTSRDCFFFSF